MKKNEINPILIEFIGVTGVGKTTLINSVKTNLLKQEFSVKSAEEFILESYNLNFVNQRIIRSVLMDLLAFVPFLSFMSRSKGRQLIRLGTQIILRDSNHFFTRVNLLRNFAKRIGIYVFLNPVENRRKNNINCDLILWDEGVLQIAHNLFVHANTVPNLQEIEDFKQLVPPPKIVVWVTASPEQSIQCTLTRGHKRVEKDIDLVKQFVGNACLTFERLFADQTINTQILTVDNTYHNVLEKDNKYLENKIIQIVNLVKANREQVKC